MSLLDDLRKKAEENTERWKAMDSILQELNNKRQDPDATAREIAELNSAVLLLLVEQLRPMGEATQAIDEIQDSLKNMLNQL